MTDTAANTQSVEFVGRRTPLFWLLIKNGIFTILTIGIYRFWAKTHVRRYYWNNISIAGDRLEYLGRPIELLIGFLIAIAILLPLGFATTGLGLAFAFIAPGLEAASNVAFFVALVWLGNFALYRMRRYRMTRTSWRGIRAGQTGSAVRYAFLRLALTVASFLSLGLAYPWARITLHRYAIPNTWFGNTSLGFDGNVRQLFRLWIPVQISIFIFVAVVAFLSAKFINLFQLITQVEGALVGESAEQELVAAMERINQQMTSIAVFTIPAYALLAVTFIWFRVAELRYVFSNITLAGAYTKSDFRFRSVLGRAMLLSLTSLLVLAGIIAAVTLPAILLPASPMLAPIAFLVLVLPAGLVLLTLQHLVFWRPLIRAFCQRLQLRNSVELERIAQSTAQDPKYGEGLADALAVDFLPV